MTEFVDDICECEEPCDICIEHEGKCATPDDCACKRGDELDNF